MNYRLSLSRLLLAVIAIAITGCAASLVKKTAATAAEAPDAVAKKLEAIAAKAPDAAAHLLDELKTKKIIFFSDDHIIMNEEMFLAEHLQEFYDAGVRYFFSESNITKVSFLPTYPWMNTGSGRVEMSGLSQTIVSLEQSTADTDPFKVVLAEEGRIADIIELGLEEEDSITAKWLNYRDDYAAKKIIETLDNAPEDAKAIVYFGGAHGIITASKETQRDGTQIDRFPLGYLLSERYGSDFTSVKFLTEIRPQFEDEWKQLISTPKIISQEDAQAMKDILYYHPSAFSKSIANAFIVDSQSYFGTPSNYVPNDDNLQFWMQTLKEYELKDPKWVGLPQIEQDGTFLIMVYYLKLYYGDHFNYALWKIPGEEQSLSLLHALEALELYSFNESVKPSDMIQFHHSLEDMRLYCFYMFYSLLTEVTYYGRDIADIVETGNIQYIIDARELFPEDLWTLYWLAFIQTETGSYAEGLANFQELFANDLSLNMSSLPLAYKKAAKCATALGNTSLAAEYAALSESLYNEHDIDPSIGPFSVEVGYHLK